MILTLTHCIFSVHSPQDSSLFSLSFSFLSSSSSVCHSLLTSHYFLLQSLLSRNFFFYLFLFSLHIFIFRFIILHSLITSPMMSRRYLCATTRRLLNHGKPQNPAHNAELTMKIEPIKRTGETIDIKRARLVYQSRKRGILESDLLLSRFAKKHLNSFNDEQLNEYDELLDEADWDIYYWATKNYSVTPLPDKWKNSQILKLLQEETEHNEGEILRMPDL